MRRLSEFTPARVSLGLTGSSLPTRPLLDFRLAQARARDAVHSALDTYSLARELAARSWPAQFFHSAARDRAEYLRRPDRGRLLDPASVSALADLALQTQSQPYVFVLADGLSSLAVHRHALALLQAVFVSLDYTPDDGHPLFVVEQGRVAVGDHIGELAGAEMAVVIIGERPGLSSPDSLGIYLTWNPKCGGTDAGRNCISNIHSQGLAPEMAAHRLAYLMREARRRKLSGVYLKESAGHILGP